MAINMYLKLDGIEGGSSAAGHDKEIEILSWNHGFSQPTMPTRSSAGAGTVEQAHHQNLSFSKYLDGATDDLLKHCWNGMQIAKGVLTCYRADGADDNAPVAYLTVTMEHIIVANLSLSAGPGDMPVENVSLDYGIIKYQYMPQSRADGTAGDPVAIQHDLETRTVS